MTIDVTFEVMVDLIAERMIEIIAVFVMGAIVFQIKRIIVVIVVS
jgi:hypothetical protein